MFRKQHNLFGGNQTYKKSLEESAKVISEMFEKIDKSLGAMPEMLEALQDAGTGDEAVESLYSILEETRSWAHTLLPFNRNLDRYIQDFEQKNTNN